MMELKDIKLKEQETRLILFESTIFKLKYRVSHEVREVAMKSKTSAERMQNDLKRVMTAVLSQVLSHNALPHVRTDNIIVYTGSCPWTSCSNLYFADHHRQLIAHPRIILLMILLSPHPSSLTTTMTTITSRLGKHKKCRGQTVDDDDDNDCHTSRLIENDTTPPCHDGGDVCMPRKKLRTEFEKAANVPDASEASLPTERECAREEEGRPIPERHIVQSTAEEMKERLHTLSQSSWDEEKELENQEVTNRSKTVFQYIKSFFSWL